MFGVGVDDLEVENLGSILTCEAGKFPFTYLRLPIWCKSEACQALEFYRG